MGYGISMGALWHLGMQRTTTTNENTAILDISMTNFLSTVTVKTQRLLSFYSSSSSNSRSDSSNASSNGTMVPQMDLDKCFVQLERKMFESRPLWEELDAVGTTIFLHRNGQADSCGNSTASSSSPSLSNTSTNTTHPSASSSTKMIFRTALQELHDLGHACPDFSNKYHVESFLTRVLVRFISPTSNDDGIWPSTGAVCHSDDDDDTNQRNTRHLGLYDYCDMGDEQTPILLDHNKLIPNSVVNSPHTTTYTLLPCHFHTEHGLRVTSLLQFSRLLLSSSSSLQSQDSSSSSTGSARNDENTNCVIAPDGDETCDTVTTSDVPTTNSHGSSGISNTTPAGLHLYAVPAGRVFMHVAAYIGQVIALDHVPGADPNQRVYLKVLSVSPAVFDLYNFFTKDESSELVQRALAETKESHRIKRSTTGTGEHHVNTRRTSESGFDTDGATSILIKK